MSATPQDADATLHGEEGAGKKSGLPKLLLIAAPVVVLAGAGAGLWFTGLLPKWLGMGHAEEQKHAAPKLVPPSYLDLPELVANLNGNPARPAYVKVVARLEIPKPEDVDKVRQAMPRLQDLMQTYLREMRPDELRGSAGSYRLREELIARANVAAAPARVSDVLFAQMLIQ